MSKLSDEVLSAEFVAGHEIAEDLGLWFEFADRWQQTAQQQFQTWASDQQKFLRSLTDGTPLQQAVSEHVSRSSTHCLESTKAYSELMREQGNRVANFHNTLWKPFFQTFGI